MTNIFPSVLAEELAHLMGERFTTARAIRDQHGKDESYHTPMAPDAVAFPTTTAEVAAIVTACARQQVPIVPFGAGTSLEGHVNALKGGVCISLARMDRIVAVRPDDLDATVEAGVTREQLNTHLRDQGLFFPVDPGANASLGGMASTRASGTNAVRYGTMRENVLALTVVLADGRVIRTARRARKSAAGYDLTRLFVGSEGTLGVITEVTLRLYGIPEAISAAVVPFASLEGAVDTVIAVMQAGIPIARIELLDERQMEAINRYSKMNHPLAPTLFLEFHGSPQSVAEQVAQVEALAAEGGGQGFQWAHKPEERSRLWEARHKAAYAAMALRPGVKAWATDVCVPIARLAECIRATKADAATASFPTVIVGHVGDGNFHMALLADPNDPKELAEAKALNERVVMRALAMDGTCTGEHGVGQGKMRYLAAEHGEALSVMRSIKRALDPLNLMNPGKMIPLE